ncbi:single-stranded DNA-binding protein [Candidatus Phytoplasma fraxini]|uniref:Single-stranded DNA-binding protein n=1 Tax=Ash yellows phytoplasma TaxID=35780 RepID=A0ABZ2U839_ASHYP
MINKVILVGRITKDPELIFINGDIPLVKFVLAVNRKFTNKAGVKEADFINCSVWNKNAENLAKYVVKGSLLGVEGSIRISNYEDNNQKKFWTEVSCENIQFLDSKKNNLKNDNEYIDIRNQNETNQNTNENKANDQLMIGNEEDLPF